MKDFQNGWSGLKEYAIKVGVATVDDGDDGVASKIKAVLQGTLPEEAIEVPEEAAEVPAEAEVPEAVEGSEALVDEVAATLRFKEE